MRGFYRLEWSPVGMGLVFTDPDTGEKTFKRCGYHSEVPNSPDRPDLREEDVTVVLNNNIDR